MKPYLTEDSLNCFLRELFPESQIYHDKSVPSSAIKNRPDYRIEPNRIIVEFDGDRHYTQFENIVTDAKKDKIYSSLGYKIIRIPYFVQFSCQVIKHIFNLDTLISHPDLLKIQYYPHGFIDDNAVLPWNYCEKGIKRFLSDLERFDFIKLDILASLSNKKIDMPILIQDEMSLYHL